MNQPRYVPLDRPDFRPVRLDLASPPDWAGHPIPERPWIVPGWLPARQVTMLSGDGGLGKSLLAIQLMASAALGETWLGQRVEPCKSLGVFCEDDMDELHRRVADVAQHHGHDLDDLGDMMLTSRVGLDSALVTFPHDGPAEPTDLMGTIMAQAVGMEARIVVLDSLHDLFTGNENVRTQARAFIGHLRSLAMEIDGAVIVTAHPSLSGRNTGTGEAGSTAWNNAVRSRLYLTSPEDDPDANRRVLRRMKANYGPRDAEIAMTWHQGAFVADGTPSALFQSLDRKRIESEFLAALDRLAAQGRYVSASVNAVNYAPKALRKQAGLRYQPRDIEGAMNALFDRGEIVVGDFRTNQRKTVTAIIRKAPQ